jgi:hypothetical protein
LVIDGFLQVLLHNSLGFIASIGALERKFISDVNFAIIGIIVIGED